MAHESDFNENDARLISMLDEMYPMELIDDSEIIDIDNHYFVFKKKDAQRLTEQQRGRLIIDL